jgi:hypothetical protein
MEGASTNLIPDKEGQRKKERKREREREREEKKKGGKYKKREET